MARIGEDGFGDREGDGDVAGATGDDVAQPPTVYPDGTLNPYLEPEPDPVLEADCEAVNDMLPPYDGPEEPEFGW